MGIDSNTQNLQGIRPEETDVKQIIRCVYDALVAKGYNPISQIVGYIMSGDPTYITGYQNARSMIMRVDRDELLEEFVKNYVDKQLKHQD